MSCTGSRYEMTRIRELDGSVRMVPRMSADRLVEKGKATILERSILVAEKETRIVKKDGSIHQLPAHFAEKLIENGKAKLYAPEKKEKKAKAESKPATKDYSLDAGAGKAWDSLENEAKEKALEAPVKDRKISKPKKKK